MPLPSLELVKNTCLTQRSRGSRHGVVVCRIVSKIWITGQDIDCALSYDIWLLQVNEELSRLSFWPWRVGGGTASLLAAHVCSMWRAAERRFVGHVCLRNSFLPFWEFQASTPYQKLQVPESHSTLHQFWIIASCPSLCCCRKNLSQAKNWTIAEIELLATVGWKWGCQPFGCRCSKHVFVEIYASTLPEAWGPWELQHAPPPHYGRIMLARDRVVVSKLWITGIDCDLGCYIQRLLQVSEELSRFGF